MSRLRRVCWLAVCGGLFTSLASGQLQQQWARGVESGEGADTAYSVVLDTSGNVYVAGISGTFHYYYVQKYRAADGYPLWTASYTLPGAGAYPPFSPAPPVLVADWSKNTLYMIGTDRQSAGYTLLLWFYRPNTTGDYQPFFPFVGITWPQSAVLDTNHYLYIAGFALRTDSHSYPFVLKWDQFALPLPRTVWLEWFDPNHIPTPDPAATEWGTVSVALGTASPLCVYVAASVYSGLTSGPGAYALDRINDATQTRDWLARSGNGVDEQQVEALAVGNYQGSDYAYVTGRRVTNFQQPSEASSFLTVQFDYNGSEKWQKTEGSVSFYLPENRFKARAGGYDVAADSNGNCYVTGSAGVPDQRDATYNFLTMKYDWAGNRRWYSLLDRGDFDLGRRLVLASGYLYATGCSWNPTPGQLEYATVRYNLTTGLRVESAYYGDGNIDWAAGLAVLPSLGYVAVTGGAAPYGPTNWRTVLYVPPTAGPSR